MIYYVTFLIQTERDHILRFYVQFDVTEEAKDLYGDKCPLSSPFFRNILKQRVEKKLDCKVKMYDVRVQEEFYDDLDVYDQTWACIIKGGCPNEDITWYLIKLERKSE